MSRFVVNRANSTSHGLKRRRYLVSEVDATVLALITAANNCSINILLISLLRSIHCTVSACWCSTRGPRFPSLFFAYETRQFSLAHTCRVSGTPACFFMSVATIICTNLIKVTRLYDGRVIFLLSLRKRGTDRRVTFSRVSTLRFVNFEANLRSEKSTQTVRTIKFFVANMSLNNLESLDA